MPGKTDLKAILENILAGKATAKERKAVRRALTDGTIFFAAGDRSVAAGQIEGTLVIIGDHNQVELPVSKVDYQRLREELSLKPSGTAQSLPWGERILRAAAFLPWLFAAIAISLITEIAFRFFGSYDGRLNTISIIPQIPLMLLAVIAAGLIAASLFLHGRPVLEKAPGLSALVKRFDTKKTVVITGIALVIAVMLALLLPRFARFYDEQGTRFLNQEPPDLAKARQSYERAASLDPGSAGIHYNLATTCEESDPERAIKEYSLAVKYDSSLDPAYANLARLYNDRGYQYHEQGDISHALESYKRAVALKQDYAVAHYNLAAALEDLHEYPQAMEEYRAAIKSDSRLFRAYNNLARLYLSTGKDKHDYDAALNLLRDAKNFAPDDDARYSIYKNLGWANYELGNTGLAEEDLKQAIHLRPDKAAAHCLLAYMLKRLPAGRTAAAECYDCVSLSYDEKDIESKWLADAQESFKKGECNEAK